MTVTIQGRENTVTVAYRVWVICYPRQETLGIGVEAALGICPGGIPPYGYNEDKNVSSPVKAEISDLV